MAEKEDLLRKTPQDLFGDLGLMLERKGVRNLVRVASDMEPIKTKILGKSLDMWAIYDDKDWGIAYGVFEPGQTFGEGLVINDMTKVREGGVWVADVDFDRFQDLVDARQSSVG